MPFFIKKYIMQVQNMAVTKMVTKSPLCLVLTRPKLQSLPQPVESRTKWSDSPENIADIVWLSLL